MAEPRIPRIVLQLAQWTQHHSACARVTEAGDCSCGLQEAWREVKDALVSVQDKTGDCQMVTFLDVGGWHAHRARTGEMLHVYVDGDDVTSLCFRAVMHDDQIHGTAWVFALDAEGRKHLDGATGKVATEERRGRLEIRPGGPVS
jgi:hypothetical protein